MVAVDSLVAHKVAALTAEKDAALAQAAAKDAELQQLKAKLAER